MSDNRAHSDAATVAPVAFRNTEIAERNLTCVRERLPDALWRPFLQLLAESPDPDSALNLFERFTSHSGPELFHLFRRHPLLLHYAITVFGYSQYLGETLIQNSDLFHNLARERSLDRTHSREEYAEAFARFRSRSLETDIALLLARFKRREYVRIMLRDVLRLATLGETTAEISALSDVLIEEALRDTELRMRNRYGPPQRLDPDGRLVTVPFGVLSLGKLGGNELNYSSDIDLLYLYGDGDAPPDAPISNREYFIRQSQELTATLSQITREGAPFRIDLRLRPQGGEGEPAVGLAHALDYYGRHAGDWERQALIKVRHSAGDQALARQFIRQVQPFVYTPEVNFAAVETALEAREKIGSRRRAHTARHGKTIDVKLDRGGIRDIEFLVQCLQRVYGGTEIWLRSGGTMFSLQKLHDKGHLSGREFQDLTTAYEFLRALEHRLQMQHGRQTHDIPRSPEAVRVLERMVIAAARGGLTAPGAPDRENPGGEDLVQQVRRRMSAVAEIYSRIVHQQQAHQLRSADSDFRLHGAGQSREERQRRLLDRLEVDAPESYKVALEAGLASHTRRNLERFLASAFDSSERYAAVVRAPEAMKQAVAIFGISDYLTDVLIRRPEEILTLEKLAADATPAENDSEASDAPGLFPDTGDACAPGDAAVHDPVFAYLATDAVSPSEKMALLRQRYHARLFASAARDVLRPRSVWDALQETTAAADEAIRAALAIAGAPPGFAVFALGRLGTFEHDLLSDADLLFVRAEATEGMAARRTAERMVEALSAYTRDGAVFPVDARLRPHGNEGELVVTPSQLESYFAREAQVWEALTYTKLRYLAGDPALARPVGSVVDGLMRRFASDSGFTAAAREMRVRLEKNDGDVDNLKTGPGGLYDIDFLVNMRLVRHGIGDTRGDLRRRLAGVHDRGLLDAGDWRKLQRHAELLRTAEHVIRLVTGRGRKTLPVSGPARAACEQLCGRMLQRVFPEGLEITLRFALVGVREIFNCIGLE